MLEQLKETSRALRESKPGKRFQDFHRAHRTSKRGNWSRPLWIGLGVLLIVLGAVFIPTPIVPGWVPLILGAALIARESAAMARALDWLELRGCAILEYLATDWRKASPSARIVAGVSGMAIVGTATAWVYLVVLKG